VRDRESNTGDTAVLADLQARLDADYGAIDIHYLEGRLTEYVAASASLRDRALAIGDKARAANIVSWMTAAAVMSGDPRAEEYAADAEQLARETELPVVAARVTRLRSWLARYRGNPGPMETAARRLLASAELEGDRQAVVNARRALGDVLIEQGRLDEAQEMLATALEMSTQIGEAQSRTELLCGLARLALARGDVDTADRFATDALAGVRAEDLVAVSAAREALASVRSAQGRDAEAEAGFRDALEVIAQTEYRERWADASIAYARFLAERGRASEGEPILGPVERWLEDRGYVFRRAQIAGVRASRAR
jgi:ATP/maltotriose-dependent transcriptional regulator MalT